MPRIGHTKRPPILTDLWESEDCLKSWLCVNPLDWDSERLQQWKNRHIQALREDWKLSRHNQFKRHTTYNQYLRECLRFLGIKGHDIAVGREAARTKWPHLYFPPEAK